MQNLKYLKSVVDEDNRFGVILTPIAMNKTEHIQKRIALSLLEFFNGGKFVDENDIEKIGNTFYISKEKYFKTQKSRVFSIRVNINDSDEEIENKIADLQQNVKKFQNIK